MNAILNALRHPMSERLGWSLIHLLWQGTIVAMLLMGLLWLLRRRSANSRYVAACAAFLLLPVSLIVTYEILPSQAGSADTVRSVDKTTIETNAVVHEADGGRAKRPHSENIVVSRPAETILIPTVDPPRNPRVSNPDAPVVVLKEKPLTEERTVTSDVTEPADLAAPPQDTGRSLPVMLRDRIAKTIESVLPWIVAGWMIGLLMLSAWHLRGWIGLRRLRHRGVSSVPDSVQSMLLRLQKRFAISRPVTLLQSSRVSVLSLLGILKPVILLPGSVLTGLTPQQLEAVLAHELAHIRRHDYLLNLLQTAIETLLFFHPAVWWISLRIRVERENCCDDLALAVTDDRLLYAQALTRLEELRQQTSAPRPAALTLAATGGSLLDRICRVLGVPQRPARSRTRAVGVTGLSGLLTIAAALLLLLPGAMSQVPAVSANAAVAPGDGDVPSTRLGDLTVLHVVPLAEFKAGATVSLGNGHHRFDDIPEFLQGRRFTRRNGYQGILRFRVEKAQRVYFAVYGDDWGGGGNGTPSSQWRKELVTREQLEKQGWKEAGKLVGKHTLIDGQKTSWIVFTRNCKAGETFAIRTHKYQAPILFSGGLMMDGLEIFHHSSFPIFEVGATVDMANGAHRFDTIPDFLNGRRYTKRHPYQGILKFRVKTPQRVYFAVYGAEWGGGGNPSGGWRKELVTRAQLKQQGWKNVGSLVAENTLRDGDKMNWPLFTRNCKAGETFAIRTHKYQAPVLFSAKKRSEKTQAKGGKPVNGLRLTLSANKTETTMLPDGSNAKPVKLKLTFTNVSKKPIKLNTYLLALHHLKFDVKGPDSGSIRKSTLKVDIAFKPPADGDFPVIQPGRSWSQDWMWSGGSFPGIVVHKKGFIFYEILKPGTYKLRYTYENQKPNKLPLAKGTWIDSVASNEFVLTVRPPAKAEKPKSAAKPIDLGKKRVLLEKRPADKNPPGLFAIGSYIYKRLPTVKDVYQWRLNSKISDGSYQLVGRLPGTSSQGDRFEVERFERRGGVITIFVKHRISAIEVYRPLPQESVYLIADLPNRLPAGKYVAHVRINDSAEKRKPSISCLIQVPNAGVSAELKKLADAAIAIKLKGLFAPPRGSMQSPTGLDLSRILKLTGQDKDRAKFPHAHQNFAAGMSTLVKTKRTWAICSLLDHPNVDAKIYAAKALLKLAHPNSVPSLLAAS